MKIKNFHIINMTKHAIDYWTFGHFIWGIIAVLSIYPENKWISFSIANLLHMIIEGIEQPRHPNGEVLESISNHIGDILAFLVGSFIGLSLTKFTEKNKKIRAILIIINIIIFTQEIGREIFPFNWPIGKAF